MQIRRLDDIRGGARHVRSDNWDSARLLLARDGMGFSLHVTTLYAGTVNRMWYKRHLEAVYCVAGRAELHDLANGVVHEIGPGSLYALDEHDRHELVILEQFTCVCVFNPPLHGAEVHDADGSYALDAEPVHG